MEVDGIKTFSATKARERNNLGSSVTQWLTEQKAKPGFKVVDTVITQSSDNEFHCLSITLLYLQPSLTEVVSRSRVTGRK